MQNFLILVALFFLFASRSFAFPDTIRHGYVNCTTCHISPSGGGLANSYGRSLSSELLSTWSYKNEEKPMHGLINIDEALAEKVFIGGDARYISRRYENETSKTDEGFWMQAQLRGGFAYDKLKFIFSLGEIENPRMSDRVEWTSPEYYVMYSPEEKLTFRIGKYEPIYGLRMPDHNLWVKSEVGLVPWAQRDTTEFIFEDEKQFFSLSGFQSKSSVSTQMQSTGYTGSFYHTIGEKSRIGVSGMNSEGQNLRKRSLSVHSTISFSDKAYLLFESGRVWSTSSAKDVGFMRLGYEVLKGFTPLLQGQFKTDRASARLNQERVGYGFSWLPRPHFELFGMSEKISDNKGGADENYILLHYYL